LIVFLKIFIYLPKNIYSSEEKISKNIQILEKKKRFIDPLDSTTFVPLMSSWKSESFKDSTFIVFFKFFIHLRKKNYSSKKQNIQILKKKRFIKFNSFRTFNVVVKESKLQRFNLHCVIQIFHPSLRKKLFIREKT